MGNLVVFIHGFLGSSYNWGPVVNTLKKYNDLNNFDYFAVNLLGHSRIRPIKNNIYNHKILVNDLVKQWPVVDSYKKVFVVAHSFGVRPALYLSNLQNTLNTRFFDTLILEDTLPKISKYSLEFLKKVLVSGPNNFDSRAAAKDYFTLNYNDPVMANFLLSHIREDKSVYEWDVNRDLLLNLLDEDVDDELIKHWIAYEKPIYLIHGLNSKIVNKQSIDNHVALRKYPTNVKSIPNAGHWVHSEKRAEFCDFLSEILI